MMKEPQFNHIKTPKYSELGKCNKCEALKALRARARDQFRIDAINEQYDLHIAEFYVERAKLSKHIQTCI